MPNFNTHWMVAIRLNQDSAPMLAEIGVGLRAIRNKSKQLRNDLLKDFASTKDPKMAKNSLSEWGKKFDKISAHKEFYGDDYDAVTCFSAYCLGACGPDFWTLTSKSRLRTIPDTAGIHFDLGHYNRTTEQFKVALKRWRSAGSGLSPLQIKVEQSYYLGMVTHIGADLMIHQLVNTYAGAYNLLDKTFENQHGYNSLNLWNTHNKVEHFWDSYIRLGYLGDYGQIFEDAAHDPLLDGALRLPTKDGLLKEFNAVIFALSLEHDDKQRYLIENFPKGGKSTVQRDRLVGEIAALKQEIAAKKALCDWLGKEENYIRLEQLQNLPRVACDRILDQKGVKPFIYKILVDKENGAYPKDIIFDDAFKESESYQMTKDEDKFKGKSESGKLEYFSRKRNDGTDNCGNNYLTYYICPNLQDVKKFALNVFYDRMSLHVFAKSGCEIGKKLLSDFMQAINNKNADINLLDRFWNLDTGMGLRIENATSSNSHEVITRLNFCHVTEHLDGGAYNYIKDKSYLMDAGNPASKNEKTLPVAKKDASYKNPENKARWTVRTGTEKFSNFTDIFENDASGFFRTIPLKGNYNSLGGGALENFFTADAKKPTFSQAAPTKKQGDGELKVCINDVKHRLTLMSKASIVEYGQNGKSARVSEDRNKVGFYWVMDNVVGVKDSLKNADHAAKSWLENRNQQQFYVDCILPHQEKPVTGRFNRDTDGRCVFESRMLLNLEKEKDLKREIEAKKWNNVVVYNGTNGAANYGRNYAISTGREEVLKPEGTGNFLVETSYSVIRDVSPTEHIFFSLYVLIRNGNEWYDGLSKEPIKKEDLNEFIKIDCLGFVKVVLFYVLEKEGAMQLSECYIDGKRVPVGSTSVN